MFKISLAWSLRNLTSWLQKGHSRAHNFNFLSFKRQILTTCCFYCNLHQQTDSSCDEDAQQQQYRSKDLQQQQYRSKDAQQQQYRSNEDSNEDEDESFLPEEARGSPITSFSDKENARAQQPKRPPKKKSSGSKKKTKKGPLQQTVSDDSSSHRSVLGHQSQKKLQGRRVSYSQEVNMVPTTRKRVQKKDDAAKAVEPPKKRNRKTDESEEDSEEDENELKERNKELEKRITDKKATIKKHATMIQELKTRNQDLATQNNELTAQNEELTTQNEELETRNQDLTIRNDDLERQKTVAKVGVLEDKAIMLLVKEQTGKQIWKRYKFIAGEDELDVIMEEILLSTPHTANILVDLEGDERTSTLRSYFLTYGQKICDIINSKRSASQTDICKELLKRQAKGGRIPPVGNMLYIIRRKGLDYRTFELEGDEPNEEEEAKIKKNRLAVDSNCEVFDWYSNRLVAKTVGHASWGPNQKHFGHLSTYSPGGSTEPYVPANAEAFVVLLWENAEEKWKYMMRCQEKNRKPNMKSVKMKTKYSSSSSGHNVFGGWNQAGRDRFEELTREISE